MSAVTRKEALEGLFTKLAQSYIARGVTHFHSGDHTAALEEFDKAKNLLPDDPYIHYMIGRVNLDRSDLVRARYAFLKARSVCPRFIDVHFQLGETYRRMGSRFMKKAQRCFEAELEVHSSHGRAHQALADLFRLQGSPERAAEYSRSAALCGHRTIVRNTMVAIAI